MPVLQTPFHPDGRLDFDSLAGLIDDAIVAGAAGVLAPAVASEVEFLSHDERDGLIRFVARSAGGRVPYVVGASSQDPLEARSFAHLAAQVGAAGYLAAVPEPLYADPAAIPRFFHTVASGVELPLIVQDLQWNGPGMELTALRAIRQAVPTLAGVKIETVPAGPKYTQVREAFGDDFYICGGWAVPQMIEALDRGVDGMIPEASMVRVYAAIFRAHARGDRARALQLFRRLLPVIAFTNQEIRLSIAAFKALLVRKAIFQSETMRWPGLAWDAHSRRIVEELIDLYLDIEQELVRVDRYDGVR